MGALMAGRFLTTRWSVVLAAGGCGSEDARAALEHLASSYWFPLYAYVRRRGFGEHEARDLTQGFFALLLERDDLASASPDKGRFRAYLLTALKHYLANERERARAAKRGGERPPLSLDAASADTGWALEPRDDETPERAYERAWATAVLERALERLREDYERRGDAALFEALRPILAPGSDGKPYAVIAAELGTTEGALKVAVHRLRRRFGASLRAEIADTVADPAAVDDEVHHLFQALAGP